MRIFKPKEFHVLTFFITGKCNSRCTTCFYWQNLNKNLDIPLDEIKDISEKLGKLPALILSGGEPFLRSEIDIIAETFYNNNGVRSLTIPTNCIFTQRIIEKTRSILSKCPDLNLTINMSVDGFGPLHDEIRGVKNNFEMMKKTEIELRELRKKFAPRLTVNINTTVFKKNIHHLTELVNYAKKHLELDGHGFELLRGNPLDPNALCIPVEDFEKYKKIALETEKYYFRNKYDALTTWYILARKNYFYNLQKRALKGENNAVDCQAGTVAGVLSETGNFSVCELYPSIGNVKEYNYDIPQMLKSEAAQKQKDRIKKIKCNCTHCVYQYQNIEHNWFVSLVKIPLLYLFAPSRT